MVGRGTLIGCLAVLLVAGAAAVTSNAAEALVQTIQAIVTKDGITRAIYPAGQWNSRVEIKPDGTLRTLSGTPLRLVQSGACTYRDLAGTATITQIAKTAASAQQATIQGGPGYEGFEVSFSFAPSQPITDAAVREFAQRTHLLRLTNSWYPGPRYLEKYQLTQRRQLPAVLKVRTSGACTPMLFAFPGVDLADYFERAR